MLSFTVSGLYEGLFVMRDGATGSEWLHYTGECIQGEYAGRTLEMIPSQTMRMAEFVASWPQGTVSPPTNAWWRRVFGRLQTWHRAFVLPGMFRRTLGELDQRLPPSTLGLGVVVGRRNLVGGSRAVGRFYAMKAVKEAVVINDVIADQAVVVVADPEGAAPVAFLAGERRFVADEPGRMRADDGRVFDLAGKAIDDDERLPMAMGIFGRWYGFVATYPDAEIWRAPAEGEGG